MTKHTDGAVKAAEEIAKLYIQPRDYRPEIEKKRTIVVPRIAAIIDQETAAPELLDHLKLAEKYLAKIVAEGLLESCVLHPRIALERVSAAIAKAETVETNNHKPKRGNIMILYEWVYDRGKIAEGLFCSEKCAEDTYFDNTGTRYKGCASPLDEQESRELANEWEICYGCGKPFKELKGVTQ